MQKIIKLLSILFFIILNFNSLAFDNFSNKELKITADSLFSEKNYVDAKLIYEELYLNRKITSNDLTLKLALINEGLKNYEWTLLFLERYLIQNPEDEKTENKIITIAEAQNLSGYKQNDINLILNFVLLYRFECLATLSLLLIIFLILNILKTNKFIIQLLISAIVLISVSFLFQKFENTNEAIIIDEALLMNGPSAASNMIKKVKPGHKATSIQTIDIWSKILFDGEECYIKTSNIEKI